MRKQKIFVLILISILAVFLIAASVLKVLSMDEGNGFVITNLSDGSSIITNKTNGYQFSVNSEWRPILLPITKENIESFKTIVEKNSILVDDVDGMLASLPNEKQAENFPLFLLDLNPNHYVNSDSRPGAGIYRVTFLGADFLPTERVLNRIKSNERVSNFYQIEKNNQIVYVFELNYEPDKVKLALFARNNKYTFFFVGTNNPETYTDLSSFFDETINSFEFVDVK